MKPEYSHLKLIIEVPTQDAWDKVTGFFGIVWVGDADWSIHRHDTCILFDAEDKGFYGATSRIHTTIYANYERLSYLGFEARFLYPKINKDEGTSEGGELLKHTPAPWYYVQYAGCFDIQSGKYYGDPNLLDLDQCPEAEANAKLATLAPELWDALDGLIGLIKYNDERGIRVDTESNEYIHAVSVLEKAPTPPYTKI